MITTPKYCPQCGALLELYAVRDEAGRLVCRRCGTVISEDYLDTGPEWRSFTEEDRMRRSRVGAPLTSTLHDYGLTSYVRPNWKDPRQVKIARIQAKVRTQKDRKLIELLRELHSVSAKLGLPPRVMETMASIIRRAHGMGMIKRNNVYEYLAAAALIAARLERHPLPLKDVERVLGVSQQAIWRAYNAIIRKLRVKPAAPPKPTMFVARIASKLNLDAPVETLATRFTTLLVETGYAQGKPPAALAGAAVYLASILLDEKKNQMAIARTVGVSDATIRNRYRDIVDNFYIEVRL